MKTFWTFLNKLAYFAPALLLVFGIYRQFSTYLSRLNEPVLAMFRFRESQTSISSFWMTRGEPLLMYETPVMGAPYAIPFEFPFFQWLTALLSVTTPLSVTASARTVSFIFFIVCVALVYQIIRVLKFPNYLAVLFAALFCLSPLYLYWSATSLIESMALALSLAWLLTYILFLNTQKLRYLGLAILFGCMAALEKITTYPSAVFVGFCLTLLHFYKDFKSKEESLGQFVKRNLRHAVCLLLTVLIPLVATLIWVHFSDSLKEQNALAANLTSSDLTTFNYGTLEQRLDLETWTEIVLGRFIDHTLGTAWLLILFVAALFLKSTRGIVAVGICTLAFLTAPLIFWNLHKIHYYYQYSNGVYLVFASSVILLESFRKQAIVSLIALLIVVFSMNATFDSVFGKQMEPSKSGVAKRTLPAANWIRENTSPDSALYVFGIDWSSHVHLYAERKGIAARNSFNYEKVDSILSDIPKFTGGKTLGAIYVCDTIYESWKDENRENSRADRLREFLETREQVERYYTCTLYK